MFRTTATSFASRAAVCTRPRRAFHTSPAAQKATLTEKVANVADKVNKSVGKGLASALDTGEKATSTAKETLVSKGEEAKEKADQAEDAVERGGKEAAAATKKAKADIEKKL